MRKKQNHKYGKIIKKLKFMLCNVVVAIQIFSKLCYNNKVTERNNNEKHKEMACEKKEQKSRK